MILTRRKLAELGLEWPAMEPTDPDAPIDIDGYGERLFWAVNEGRTDQTSTRAELDTIVALMARLDELGVPYRK